MVLGKLRLSSPALTEVLEPSALEHLLSSLFPANGINKDRPQIIDTPVEHLEDMEVNIAEIIHLIIKRPAKNAAPGPDNLKAMVWKKVPYLVLSHVAELFSRCLSFRVFPVT